jgi:hypothetical protein
MTSAPPHTGRCGPLQYNMSLSTVVMPCNTSGPLDSKFFSQFGIVDVDWSHMKAVWYVLHCHGLQQSCTLDQPHWGVRRGAHCRRQLVLPEPLKDPIAARCFVVQADGQASGIAACLEPAHQVLCIQKSCEGKRLPCATDALLWPNCRHATAPMARGLRADLCVCVCVCVCVCLCVCVCVCAGGWVTGASVDHVCSREA